MDISRSFPHLAPQTTRGATRVPPGCHQTPGAGTGADGVALDPAGASPGCFAPLRGRPGGGKRLRAPGAADLSGTRGLEMAGEGELRIPPGWG